MIGLLQERNPYCITCFATGLLLSTVEVMKLYLFNLTDITIFVKSKWFNDPPELSILPSASAALTSDKAQFILSSVGEGSSSKLEKVSLERQYVVNTSKAFPFRYNLLAMPEDCPWRIYRDQVGFLDSVV